MFGNEPLEVDHVSLLELCRRNGEELAALRPHYGSAARTDPWNGAGVHIWQVWASLSCGTLPDLHRPQLRPRAGWLTIHHDQVS